MSILKWSEIKVNDTFKMTNIEKCHRLKRNQNIKQNLDTLLYQFVSQPIGMIGTVN